MRVLRLLEAILVCGALAVASPALAQEPHPEGAAAEGAKAEPKHSDEEGAKAAAKDEPVKANDEPSKAADDGDHAKASAKDEAAPHHKPILDPAEQKEADEEAVASGAPTEAEMEEHATVAESDPKKYANLLRVMLDKVRTKTLAKVEKKILDAHDKKMGNLSQYFFLFSLSGFLLLFAPLFLMKKYPGKAGTLFKFSSISAVSTVIVLNLFAVVMLLIKSAQGLLGALTNPQIKIIEATFDTLSKEADNVVAFGPQLIEPVLGQLNGHAEDPMPVLLLENVKRLGKDAGPFIDAAKMFKSVSWVLEYAPIALTAVAILLFALAAKPVLVELISLPARAASGEEGAGSRVLKKAFGTVGNEFLAAAMLIVTLLLVTLLSASVLTAALQPAIESFLAYFFINVVYLMMAKGASSGVILASLGGTMLFLVLNVAVMILSSSFYLGKAHRIFQQKFQHKVPLSAHKRFFGWGTFSLVALQLFPLFFAAGALPLVKIVIEKSFDPKDPSWNLVLLSGPFMMVGFFVAVFFAAQAFRALRFLQKYDVKTLPTAPATSEVAPPPVAQAAPAPEAPAPTYQAPFDDAPVYDTPDYGAPAPVETPADTKGAYAAQPQVPPLPSTEPLPHFAPLESAPPAESLFASLPSMSDPLPLVRRDISADATSQMKGSAMELPLLKEDGTVLTPPPRPAAGAEARRPAASPSAPPPRFRSAPPPRPASVRPAAPATAAAAPPQPEPNAEGVVYRTLGAHKAPAPRKSPLPPKAAVAPMAPNFPSAPKVPSIPQPTPQPEK